MTVPHWAVPVGVTNTTQAAVLQDRLYEVSTAARRVCTYVCLCLRHIGLLSMIAFLSSKLHV